jgi:hypothetical protein
MIEVYKFKSILYESYVVDRDGGCGGCMPQQGSGQFQPAPTYSIRREWWACPSTHHHFWRLLLLGINSTINHPCDRALT